MQYDSTSTVAFAVEAKTVTGQRILPRTSPSMRTKEVLSISPSKATEGGKKTSTGYRENAGSILLQSLPKKAFFQDARIARRDMYPLYRKREQ